MVRGQQKNNKSFDTPDGSMARSDIHPSTRKRILRTTRDRLLFEVAPASDRRKSPRDVERPKTPSRRSRARAKGPRLIPLAIAKLIVLGLVVVVGVATIIWLRNLGEAFGINWIGD